jgi:membrane protein DedA with SNARE-associated domain
MIGYGGIGAIVGAGIGFVVGSTAGEYRQLTYQSNTRIHLARRV